MEKIIKNIEKKFNNQIANFEKSPIKTSIKWLIIIYIIRKIWNWIKEEK